LLSNIAAIIPTNEALPSLNTLLYYICHLTVESKLEVICWPAWRYRNCIWRVWKSLL